MENKSLEVDYDSYFKKVLKVCEKSCIGSFT